MSTEILISSDPWENRVAILEDGVLSELYIEREEKVIGSIYKGKVQNVLPGMGASFVDIGLGRNAFLYVDDINKTPLNIGDVEITQGRSGWTISEKVNRGDDVLVQIVKEPRGLKGARVSTNISLPGRYLILMPTGKYSGVSRKIDSSEERNRLKSVMKRIRPEGMATVVRTAAAGVSEAELIADLGVLIRMWHGILETYKRAKSPSLLHKDMNLIYKAARDFVTADVDRVLIDNEEEYRKVRDFLQLLGPQYLDRLEHYGAGRELFKDYKVDDELQKLMKPKINLPSGGSIVIETTEALTVIDVNSGKFTGGKNLDDTIVKTNVEAAAEIARQVRLRDIGGIIVCDFIDMSSEPARNKVIKTLEDGLRKDRTRATIQSFSNLGLLEFTRKRVGKDLGAQLRGACPTCAGLGSVMSAQSVAIETLRKVRIEGARAHDHQPIVVESPPTVAPQLEFWYEDEFAQLAKELDVPIRVRVDATLHPEVTRVRVGSDVKDGAALRVGDEREVELLPGRLPNVTSAAAVLEGRVVEVENAANLAGQSVRIKIIDLDEDYVLAELGAGGAAKRKGRHRGRKAKLTAAEQAAQLRELAAEAAQTSVSRPPIGITTVTEEEETADKVLRVEAKALREPGAIVIGDGGDGERKHRRRRRGRGRGRGGSAAGEALQVGIPPQSAQAQLAAHEDSDEAEDTQPPAAASAEGEGEVRRHRRRRRRRRGRGGLGAGVAAEGMAASAPTPTPAPAAVPDRHIFRVDPEGKAEPTGRTAPREPSRAIAPWNRKVQPPAVESPPPHLRVPEESAIPTKPARRRRTPRTPVRGGELQATPVVALPVPEAAVSAAESKRKRAAGGEPKPAPVKAKAAPKAAKAVAKPAAKTAVKATAKAAPKRAPKAAAKASEPPAGAKAPAKRASAKKSEPASAGKVAKSAKKASPAAAAARKKTSRS